MKHGPNLLGAKFAATRLIDEYGIDRPELIDPEIIAFARSIIVKTGEIEGAEAWLLRHGNKGLIRVSSSIRETGRRRFAIAHELGHWELHAGTSHSGLCTTNDIQAYRGSSVELEANAFAAELLMPRLLLQTYLTEDASISLIHRISQVFQSTLTASAVRLVEESSQNCYVVFSSHGNVTWWRSKENGPGLWINAKQPISPETKAFACNNDPSYPEPMEIVPSEAWFQDDRDACDYEVWEQSVLLRDYDVVLTLLYIV